MLDVAATAMLLLPAAWIAMRSRAASMTGYFIIYAWLAEALVFALFGLAHFLAAVLVLVTLALLFRSRLDMKRWWTANLRGK